MRNGELEESQDDLDVEITSLDEGKAAGLAPGNARLFARRHKGPLTMAMVGMVALAVVIILFSSTPIRRFLIPAPVQTIFSYRLDANPPWGHLSVDGQAVKMASGGIYPLFSLTRGKHTLLWRADPFSPQQCIITVPEGSGIDTCKHPEIPPMSGGTSSYISFPTDLTMLSTVQRAALLQATQAVLDSRQSSEMVRAGDLYAQTAEVAGPNSPSCTVLQVAALCFANAHQPLKATLRLQLDTTSWSRVSCAGGACASNGQNCHLFCTPFFYAASDGRVSSTLWQATVHVQLFWRFSALDGRLVADNQADTFIRGQQNDIAMPLNITWDGQRWGVSMSVTGDYAYSGDPVCDAAMNDLYNLENAVPATTRQDTQSSMKAIQGTTFASGCLIEFKMQTGLFPVPTPTAPPPVVAYVMQRFGVLLAVNSAAHRLFPFLPVTNAYEKQLAQRWAGRQVIADVYIKVRNL